PKMIDREPDCRMIGYGAMLMEGLVGITALVAASCLSPPDYFAINTDPDVSVVAAEPGGPGLARAVDDLAKLDEPAVPADNALAKPAEAGVLDDTARALLGLAPGQPARSLAPEHLKASRVLHLSNRALAALDYGVDPTAQTASSLSDADFLRLGIKVTDLPSL